jgi:eukaryotic-like serine/threonine-protein kinase
VTEDQWKSVETHFDTLRELSPDARAAALEAIADAEVRREVASLLLHAGEGETVAQAIGAMAETVDSGMVRIQRIGPYRLVRRLGQGGQGTVFEAVRDDGSFHQRVAIKIVRWENDSASARNQFRQERQTLAKLEHPNIARLLDGGESADGTPYLVMEFIDGLPLTAAAKDWPLKRKLEVFLEVAAAVAFAHRNLIVHRDLKPANILVTGDGVPKLLDFGIAKLLDADSQRTLTLFQTMTPEYASPEQVSGEPITTACDVYSLGMVLYELLTGRRPYQVPTKSPVEIHKAVCLTEPAPPNVSEDLDNILMMALRKEPARRYPSVEQFARDIERSVQHRPVIARKDTLRYRAGKFVRRNALALATVGGILLAIGGGTAAALQQARIAGQRFEQVRRLAHSFVFDYHDELARIEGTTSVREKMVATALEYLDNLSRNAGNDPGIQKELASAYEKVGDAQGSPGKPNLGHANLAIASYRKADEIHQRIAAADPSHRSELGEFYINFAQLLRLTNNFEEATRMAESASRSLELAARNKPDDQAIQISMARSWCIAGDLDEDRDHSAAAYREDLKCDSIARAALRRWHNRDTLALAQSSRERVGTVAVAIGHVPEALTAFDENQQLIDELLQLEPANPLFRRAYALLAQFRSSAYYDDGGPSLEDPVRCLAYSRQYLEAARQLAARDPKNASAQLSLAIALFRLSFPLKHSDPAGAIATARESVVLFDRLIADGKNTYLVVSRRARALRRLSEALLFAGHTEEARATAGEALAGQRKVAARDPKDRHEGSILSLTLVTAAEAADAARDWPSAAAWLMEAEPISAAIYAQDRGELNAVIPLARVRTTLRDHWKKAGDDRQSQHWQAEALRLWQEFPDQNEFVKRKMAAISAR